MKPETSAVLVCLVCACWIAPWFETSAQVKFSQNIVGYVGGETDRVASISGTVVQLRSPANFDDCKEKKERVALTGVWFRGEFGFAGEGEEVVLHDWIRPTEGGVETVSIEGKSVALSNHSFTNGCLVTREYGSLPIAFASDGEHSVTNVGYRCALATSDEQLARLLSQLPSVSKGDIRQETVRDRATPQR